MRPVHEHCERRVNILGSHTLGLLLQVHMFSHAMKTLQNVHPTSVSVDQSTAKLKTLAFAHLFYYFLKNDPRCVGQDGHPVNADSMQLADSDVCRYV